MMNKWRYEGPVMSYGKLVSENWVGETVATSEEKAQNNLLFRFKKETNRCARTVITMPGTLTLIT